MAIRGTSSGDTTPYSTCSVQLSPCHKIKRARSWCCLRPPLPAGVVPGFGGWAVGAGLQERPAWCALCCWRHGEKSVCREYTSVTQGASVMLLTVKGPFPAAALSCLGCGVKTCETAAVHCFWAQLAGWAAPQQTKGERLWLLHACSTTPATGLCQIGAMLVGKAWPQGRNCCPLRGHRSD